MNVNQSAARGLALVLAISTAACGTMNGTGNNAASMVAFTRNPDYGPLLPEHFVLGVRHANSCMEQIDPQLSSMGESMATGAVVHGVSGAASGGAVSATTPNATAPVYVPYMATVSAIAGATNGAVAWSANRATLVGSCVGANLNDPLTRRQAPGVHAFGSYVRTTNPNAQTVNEVPDWLKDAQPAATSPEAPQ